MFTPDMLYLLTYYDMTGTSVQQVTKRENYHLFSPKVIFNTRNPPYMLYVRIRNTHLKGIVIQRFLYDYKKGILKTPQMLYLCPEKIFCMFCHIKLQDIVIPAVLFSPKVYIFIRQCSPDVISIIEHYAITYHI